MTRAIELGYSALGKLAGSLDFCVSLQEEAGSCKTC